MGRGCIEDQEPQRILAGANGKFGMGPDEANVLRLVEDDTVALGHLTGFGEGHRIPVASWTAPVNWRFETRPHRNRVPFISR